MFVLEDAIYSVIVASVSVIIASIVVSFSSIFINKNNKNNNSKYNEQLEFESDAFDGFDNQLKKRWMFIKNKHNTRLKEDKYYSKTCKDIDTNGNFEISYRQVIDAYGLDIWASEHNIDIKLTEGKTSAIAKAVRDCKGSGSKMIKSILTGKKVENADFEHEQLFQKLKNVFTVCDKYFDKHATSYKNEPSFKYMTIENIKSINKDILSDLKRDGGDIPKGIFRTESSSGGINSPYMQYSDIEYSLKLLLGFSIEMWNNTKSNSEKVLLAAFFLERFLFIHPFENGNGRTGRILVSILLRDVLVVPVCIFHADDDDSIQLLRFNYIQLLNRSRSIRNPNPYEFCNFVLQRTFIHLSKMKNTTCK